MRLLTTNRKCSRQLERCPKSYMPRPDPREDAGSCSGEAGKARQRDPVRLHRETETRG